MWGGRRCPHKYPLVAQGYPRVQIVEKAGGSDYPHTEGLLVQGYQRVQWCP
jgi:hypothetical protein